MDIGVACITHNKMATYSHDFDEFGDNLLPHFRSLFLQDHRPHPVFEEKKNNNITLNLSNIEMQLKTLKTLINWWCHKYLIRQEVNIITFLLY